MKRMSMLLCSLCLSIFSVSHAACSHGLLVGNPAPGFTAKAVVDGNIADFSLSDLQGKYVVLVFYPLDFTFVCPTELQAFQKMSAEFEKRNAQVVACSVDSPYTHLAWLSTPASNGGIEGITYPLVADLDKSIARNFHVLNEKEGIAYRGLFVIDRDGVVRHQLVNDLPIGRNVDEALRFLDALATYETQGEVCPANWQVGDKTMQPTQEGLVDYFK